MVVWYGDGWYQDQGFCRFWRGGVVINVVAVLGVKVDSFAVVAPETERMSRNQTTKKSALEVVP